MQNLAARSINNDPIKYAPDSSDDDVVVHLKVGDIIQNRFLINSKIGEGSFGQVFKVVDQRVEGQTYAMKVEEEADEVNMLEKEIKVLIEMRKKLGFPQIKFYGLERGFTYCVMSLLGKNMETIARKLGGSMSTGTILKVAIQMIDRIETLHSCRFLHRDIKPDNFVLEAGPNPKQIYLIDFGLSKHYTNSKGEHIQYVKKAGLIGTARYASVAAHEEMEQGRKDDLESIGYVLIYLGTGTLPWMNLQIEQKELKYAKIHQMKKNIKMEVLCSKLPKGFVKFMSDVRALDFKAQPDYAKLRSYFQDELDQFNKTSSTPANQYDWDKLPEYQQKKKHLTIHVMQSKQEISPASSPLQKQQKGQSPVKRNQLNVEQQPRQTFEQMMEDRKKGTKRTVYSPTGNQKGKKNCILINIQEPETNPTDKLRPGFLNVPESGHNYSLLIPQFGSQNMIDTYAPSVATSKINNYQQSEEVVSEGGLPIWDMGNGSVPGFQIVQGIMQGIKKPSIVFQRKDRKAHTCIQIDTIRTMSKMLVQPKTIKGDEETGMEGLD